MQRLTEPLDAGPGPRIETALRRLRDTGDLASELITVLDIAIDMTGADKGTLQRFDEGADCLELVASRGFSSRALGFFAIVRRDTNTTCGAAFTRRMRVFVEDVSTSYLFVGTPELDLLRAEGIVAAQSTPLISSKGHLWGVLSTHFHEVQREIAFDHAPLDRLAVLMADSLKYRESRASGPRSAGRTDGRH